MSLLIIIIGLLSTATGYVMWCYYHKRRHLYHHTSKLDGPLSLPFIGSAFYFLGDTKNIVNNIVSMTKKYKSPWKIWLGGQVFVILTDPEDVEIVLKKCLEKPKGYKFVESLLGEGLFTGPVNKWKKHRKVIKSTFNMEILNSHVETLSKHSEILVETLQNHVGEGIFDVYPHLAEVGLAIMSETIIGIPSTKQSDYVRNLANAMDLVYTRILRFWLHPELIWKLSCYGKEFVKLTDEIKSFIVKMVTEKQLNYRPKNEEGRKRKVFLDHLIELCSSEKWTNEELIEETQTMAASGADSLASIPSFALIMLGMHPQIQEKVHQELETIFDSDRAITSEDLNKMAYLDLVIKETLRLFPVTTAIGRSVDSDICTKSYTIPQGAECIIGILHIHRSPDIWKEPLKFDPDRFIPEEVAKRHQCSYLPFSTGPRNCIGSKFATMAIKTTLASILRNFRISTDVKNVSEIEAVPGIVFKSAVGYRVALEKQNPNT